MSTVKILRTSWATRGVVCFFLGSFVFAGPRKGIAAAAADKLTGSIQINGSSTVAPVMMLTAEMFRKEQPDVRVTVGIAGTGGGFKMFLEDQSSLRTDIHNASRSIDPAELDRAKSLGVEFIELPIAWDGIAVVVNSKNDFCKHLTVDELKRIWSPESTIRNWKDIRPGFPDVKLKLYGPGADSGTFDYFTQVICGKEKASRNDFNASERDDALVQGVAGDRGALGYFGLSYFEASKTKLHLVSIDPGDGTPVAPTIQSVRSGEYRPLSRPLFIYVNAESAKRPQVQAFVDFFFANSAKIVEHPKVNYVALTGDLYDAVRRRFHVGKTGTALAAAQRGKPSDLQKLYSGQ